MAYLREIDLLSLTDYKLFIIFPDKKKEKERLDFIDFYQQWPSFFWNHCDTIWKWKKSENVNHSVVSDFLKPMDCSPPVSSVLGILQARILEWVAISFSRGSSWPRDWTLVSGIKGRFSTVWATKEAHNTIWLTFFYYLNLFPGNLKRGRCVCVCVCMCVS